MFRRNALPPPSLWLWQEWDFGMYFPSNSQLGTLHKIILKRNALLDEQRAALVAMREHADANYEDDVKVGLIYTYRGPFWPLSRPYRGLYPVTPSPVRL